MTSPPNTFSVTDNPKFMVTLRQYVITKLFACGDEEMDHLIESTETTYNNFGGN